jgi:NAD(P)-dependent dehydrogenase (short-subunit alcohol dehydrogenase family)
MSAGQFAGAVVLITGAGRGLGRAGAERFAAEGARLVLGDIAADELTTTADTLRARGAEVETVLGDVAHPSTADALVERALNTFERLDVAINNAGIAHGFSKLRDLDPATMELMLAVNVMGVFHGMRRQIAAMERQFDDSGRGGVILNVASVAGVTGAPLLSAYAAAKHAVVGLTRSAAAETARRGVRINALCPAFADTAMAEDLAASMRGGASDAVPRMVSAVPMRRLAQPGEIVSAMLFACSPENGFMTGQTLVVDGGLTAL